MTNILAIINLVIGLGNFAFYLWGKPDKLTLFIAVACISISLYREHK